VLFQIQNINNDFGREVGALFRKVRFGDHPYANMTVGDAESVSKITAADLRTFHDRLCVGDNTVLAVGGDIDIEKTRKMIESAFGEMPQGEKQPNHVPPPPTIGKDSKGVAAPVAVNVPRQQVNVILATNGIAIGDADDAAMNILTNMFSGNLYQALRGRNNYVYIISVFHAPGVDAGTLEIFAQTTPDKYDVMMKEIRVEIDKMKNGKFTDEEFEAAKRQAVYYAQMDLQTNAEQADAAALNELYGLGYDYAAKNALRLSKVTRQDLTKLIERCFGEWMVVETRPAPPDKPAPVPDPADEE
jgi:zinc protease